MARWQPAERNARYIKARGAGLPVVVSEGDSWFDYPMYRNIIDRIDDKRRFALKRLEFSGDTVAHMIGDGTATSGVQSLETVITAEGPRFLLFSGGGNDIVGEEFTDGVKVYDATQSAEWHLDTPVWRALKRGVGADFRTLIKCIGPLVPVFAHGYDFIVPSDTPARYDGLGVAGPWVWPELARKNIPDALMIEIGRTMIDWFNDLLRDFETEFIDRGWFAHLDLRGTLAGNQWANEIHPTEAGFSAVTERFLSQLDDKLGPTLTAHDAVKMGIA